MFKFFVIMIFTCDMKMTREIKMQAKMLTTTRQNKACATRMKFSFELIKFTEKKPYATYQQCFINSKQFFVFLVDKFKSFEVYKNNVCQHFF